MLMLRPRLLLIPAAQCSTRSACKCLHLHFFRATTGAGNILAGIHTPQPTGKCLHGRSVLTVVEVSITLLVVEHSVSVAFGLTRDHVHGRHGLWEQMLAIPLAMRAVLVARGVDQPRLILLQPLWGRCL